MVSLPKVDLDLFVNSLAKGVQIGNAAPSSFSSFFGGLIKGIDDQQEYEKEEQLQAIRQNQIDLLPLQNRLQEAQTLKAEAEVSAYRADPNAFIAAKLSQQEAVIAEQRRQELLNQKRTEFLAIMEGPDNTAKADAMLGGQFTDLLAEQPALRKEVLQQATGWEPENFERLYEGEYAQIRAQHMARSKVEATQRLQTAASEYESSANVGQLENDVAAARPDEPVNRLDLALYGEVRTEKVYPKTTIAREGPDGNPQLVEVDDLSREPKWVKNFYYGRGKDKQLIREVDPDTFKEYDVFQKLYRRANDLDPHSGGVADLQRQARLTTAQREAQRAQAQQEADAARNNQDAGQFFSSSIKPAPIAPDLQGRTPQFQRALEASRNRIQSNQAEAQAPVAAPEPALTPVPTAKARLQVSEALPGPALTPTPAPSSTSRPSNKSEELKARAASRVRSVLEKRGVQASQSVPAERQVSAFTPARFMPDVMTPRTSVRPRGEVVQQVKSVPSIRNAPAVVKAIIAVESEGRGDAISPTGVKGLSQMEQATAQGLFGTTFDVNSPAHNILGAATMFEVAMTNPVLRENPLLAIAAYNGGEPVIADAVRKAGYTPDWNVVKEFIPQAVSENPKLKKIKGKAQEIIQYVDKVVSYFPSFAKSTDDYEMAKRLKATGILDFEDGSPGEYV